MTTKETIGLQVQDIIFLLIGEAPTELRMCIKHNEVRLSIPGKLLEAYYAYDLHRKNKAQLDLKDRALFHNEIWMEETEEPAITLYHKDYPTHRREWMCRKIVFDTVERNGEVEYLINLPLDKTSITNGTTK